MGHRSSSLVSRHPPLAVIVVAVVVTVAVVVVVAAAVLVVTVVVVVHAAVVVIFVVVVDAVRTSKHFCENSEEQEVERQRVSWRSLRQALANEYGLVNHKDGEQWRSSG